MKSRYKPYGLFTIIITVIVLFSFDIACAETFCVSAAPELHAALTTAQSNGQDDIIRIVQGTYNGNFVYNSAEPYALTILGGYSTGCTTQVLDPGNTTISADGAGTALNIQNGSILAVMLQVSGLSLENSGGSGLSVYSPEGHFVLADCWVRYNSYPSSSGEGGGARIETADLTISRSTFAYNYAYDGGAARITSKRVDLRDNMFIFNTSGYGGALAIKSNLTESINLVGNLISNNQANHAEGGGIEIGVSSATINFTNNVLSKNATVRNIGGGHGGGAHISGYGILNFINNTVVGNSATLANGCGGGITIYHASYANVLNNIFYDNSAIWGNDICFWDVLQTNVDLANNDIDQGSTGISGIENFIFDPSNIDSLQNNPMFIDQVNEDYHLLSSSPCRDTGTNAVPNLPTTDKDGAPRIVNALVDMGAYEYQGQYQPSAPDLYGNLSKLSYNASRGKLSLSIKVINRGTTAGKFQIAYYLSADGKTLGNLIDVDIFKGKLITGKSMTSTCIYQALYLSGMYVVAVIDSADQITESVETNNRIIVRIP
jgi:hypothetical protein